MAVGENNSAAYLAGHAHGKALAVKHAAPTAAPSLAQQAQGLARNDTQATVNSIKTQQQMIEQQAQERARQINAASQAAAGLQGGIGDQTAASYTQAAKDMATFAGGYSGDLRATAEAQAAKTLEGLQSVGGSADQIKNPAQGAQLGNVLYGLGGQVPANTLLAAGQAQAAAQRQIPTATTGYGQQQALGTLAAGDKASQALIADILNAKAGTGKAAQGYLQQLIAGHNSSALAQSLIDSRADSATIAAANADTRATAAKDLAEYRKQQLQVQADHNSVMEHQGATRAQIAAFNAQTARLRTQASKAPKGMNASQWSKLYQQADKQAETFYWGVAPKSHYDTASGKWVADENTGTPQVTYADAIARMQAAYPALPLGKIKQIVDTNYPPGQAGRPGPTWGHPEALAG